MQVGNFVAYGDKNTPASVVTAVGCVGVIANLIISTVWLGEPFRKRDVIGGFCVVCGVLLIVVFAPQQSQVPYSPPSALHRLMLVADAVHAML
jgi:drug/metabolite transporter (DMT)-like permease